MIAIIPARGGSKGLPGKNIKKLLGKPLIAWTIDAAKKSKYIDRIIVSTEDEEIAEIAKSYGAEVPFLRPDELASDTAMAIDNYIYTIGRLQKEEKIEIPEFVVLQPTSPLRLSSDIDDAISLYKEKCADSVISYTKEAHPIAWHKYLTDEGQLLDILPNTIANRQENRVSYYPNGAIYIFKTKLINSRSYTSDRTYAYIMPRNRSVDIDYQEDFDYVEFILSSKNG